jgi:hypothetical protein
MPNHIIESEKTDMANKAMTAIRSLFPGRTVNFTLTALNTSADIHGIYPGCRDWDGGKSDFVGKAVFSWEEGGSDEVDAPCAWRGHDGDSHSGNDGRQYALCLVASFG